MALARARRGNRGVDYWPGFVDALSTLLLAIMFLLSVFVLAQFLLSQEVTERDEVLTRLNAQINELTQLLALERSNTQDAEDQLAALSASLSDVEAERSRLQQLLSAGAGAGAQAEARIGALSEQLDDEKQISQRALSQVELLNQQIAALRKQIGALEAALEVSEQRDRESNTKIADLGRRLNVALAQRVQELNRYRSDFCCSRQAPRSSTMQAVKRWLSSPGQSLSCSARYRRRSIGCCALMATPTIFRFRARAATATTGNFRPPALPRW